MSLYSHVIIAILFIKVIGLVQMQPAIDISTWVNIQVLYYS